MTNKLTIGLEKYLLAIYEIVKTNKAARVKDVSNYLKIGGPATSDAIKSLNEKGYINYVPYGIITITSKGTKYAKEKLKNHDIISKFFENVLNVNSKDAQDGAKAIEYSLSDEILKKFVQYLTFQDMCSCKTPKWKKSYEYYSKHNEMQLKCQDCMKSINECNKCGCGGCCS